MERFLTHAIDHFTREELTTFKYAIIGSVKNGGREGRVSKVNILFPDPDIQSAFIQYQDKSILRKMYFEQLSKIRTEGKLYETFIGPILNHVNVVIICYEEENDYVDILVEYLKEKYFIDCIDLNQLFIKGRIGSIYIDREEIKSNAAETKRMAQESLDRALETSMGGRLTLLAEMSKKAKLKKLKELGIHINRDDMDHLDEILVEAWVED